MRTRPGFTLIELLVVIAIIALLVGILLPALAAARKLSRGSVCSTNLRSVGQSFVAYNNDHREAVIPSFNMTGIVGGPDVPLDGWGPILDRDGYFFVPEGDAGARANPLYCPETVDVAGVATGQTGMDPDNPKGWLEWPFLRLGPMTQPVTIPERGFEKIMRVAYWINADNPIGDPAVVRPDLFYTASVGYGPGTNGLFIRQTKLSAFVRPQQLISAADGLYAGRQRDARLGTTNSRIGYRHLGKPASANVAFADGHVQPIAGDKFPRALGGSNNPDDVRRDNAFGNPSVYANPERTLN